MAHIVEMPKLSDTMKEGSIVRWLKKEGEKVASGLPLVEVETDKSNMEYESPYGGVLLKILVGDGQKCPLQAPIAVIGKQDENWEEALEKYKSKNAPQTSSHGAAGTNATNAESKTAASVSSSTTSAVPSASPAHTVSPTIKSADNTAKPQNDTSTIKASPLAKKIAADLGINLSTVKGSGPNDRIVQRDLTNYQNQNKLVTTSKPISTVSAEESQEVKKIPLTNMRKTIALRLTESVTKAPHFYLKMSFDMTHLLESRKAILAQIGTGQKFSVNDMIIFFVSRALLKHPEINSSWQDDHIAEYPFVHMSVAVALPQGGLITPVVRNAHLLDIFQIAIETTRLIALARNSKLQPADYTGGTFSISNLGMTGVEDFTAIINPPQAAILAIGSTIPTPVVSNKGGIVVEQRMTVTLSCDHRVIDGLMGAQFLQTLKYYFENPLALLLSQ